MVYMLTFDIVGSSVNSIFDIVTSAEMGCQHLGQYIKFKPSDHCIG